MTWKKAAYEAIPGTYVFDGRRSLAGYALNKMCMSINDEKNRDAFEANPRAYCESYGLSDEQIEALEARDFLRLMQLGGNIYYLAKLGGIFGAGVQDIGAQMTGMTVAEFKAKLLAAAE